MEKTVSDVEFGRVPTADEKNLLSKMQAGVQVAYLGAPALADADVILNAVAWANGSKTLDGQIDCPRNIVAALTDADNSCTGTLTITGKDAQGRTITETLVPDGAGAGKTLTGTKIFAQVDSAVISGAAGAGVGDEVAIGTGNVIGVGTDMLAAAEVVHCYLGGVKVAPTIALGVSKSGINASAGTYNGTKALVAYLAPSRLA